jgi:hypothetical protein
MRGRCLGSVVRGVYKECGIFAFPYAINRVLVFEFHPYLRVLVANHHISQVVCIDRSFEQGDILWNAWGRKGRLGSEYYQNFPHCGKEPDQSEEADEPAQTDPSHTCPLDLRITIDQITPLMKNVILPPS